MGDSYKSTEVDISTGSGTPGGGTPRVPGSGDTNNRHCAAWEQVSEAFNLIADCWDRLGFDICQPDKLRQLAQACKMPKNRGE